MIVMTGKFKTDPTICDYTISQSLCCLGGIITTGASGDNLYIGSDLNICEAGYHSSPVFDFDPLVLVCVNTCTSLYQSVIADNGDSVSYSIVYPLSDVNTPISYVSPYTDTTPLMYSGYPDPAKPFDLPYCY